MPRAKSAKSLRDLCVGAVAVNLASVSWDSLFAAAGDSQIQLQNPFETFRNTAHPQMFRLQY